MPLMMHSKRRRLLAALFALGLTSPARAAFQYPPSNPQAVAVGNSIMSALDDSSALFVNPSAMSRSVAVDMYFVHNQLYAGLPGVGSISEGLATFGVPSRYGVFGFGFSSFRASGLYQERTLALGYAKQVGRFDLGLAGKQLFHSFDVGDDPLAAGDPVFAGGTSRSAFAVDLGVMAEVYGPLRGGLVVRNLNRPDVGLATEDRVERELQGGLSYDFARYGLRVTTDLLYRAEEFADGRKLLPSIGFQKSLQNRRVLFRLGANPLEYSGGIGLRFGRVGFDYALILRRYLIESNAGTHSFGVRVQFGGPRQRNRPQLEDDPDTNAVELE